MSDRFAKIISDDTEIVEYLTSAYDVTEERAAEIVQAHKDDVDAGKARGSFIHYIGDEIANDEALEELEHEDEEIAEQDDDT